MDSAMKFVLIHRRRNNRNDCWIYFTTKKNAEFEQGFIQCVCVFVWSRAMPPHVKCCAHQKKKIKYLWSSEEKKKNNFCSSQRRPKKRIFFFYNQTQNWINVLRIYERKLIQTYIQHTSHHKRNTDRQVSERFFFTFYYYYIKLAYRVRNFLSFTRGHADLFWF